MRLRIAGALGALALGLVWAGCRAPRAGEDLPPSDPGIRLEARVAPTPYRTGIAHFAVTLTDAKTNGPLAGARVRLEGNMTHPGMVPVEATAEEGKPGVYEAPVDLNMAGDWIFLIEATLPDGRRAQAQVDLPNVAERG